MDDHRFVAIFFQRMELAATIKPAERIGNGYSRADKQENSSMTGIIGRNVMLIATLLARMARYPAQWSYSARKSCTPWGCWLSLLPCGNWSPWQYH